MKRSMTYQEIADALRHCSDPGTCTPDCPRAGTGNGCIRGLKLEAAAAIHDLLSERTSVDKLTNDGLLLLKYWPEAINALAERLFSKLDDAFLYGMKGDGHAKN